MILLPLHLWGPCLGFCNTEKLLWDFSADISAVSQLCCGGELKIPDSAEGAGVPNFLMCLPSFFNFLTAAVKAHPLPATVLTKQ